MHSFRTASVVFSALAISTLVGCSVGSNEHVERGPIVGDQGRSWELVAPSPYVADRSGFLPDDAYAEYYRRDRELAYRPAEAVTANDYWPQRPTPSLDDRRYLYVPRNSNQFLYFGDQQYQRGPYAPFGW